MSKNFISLITVLALISVSGCTQKQPIVQAVKPVAVEVKQPLKIATWSPTKYDGRFTGMGLGYLTVFNNCLTMTMGNEGTITESNTYLLVLADNS